LGKRRRDRGGRKKRIGGIPKRIPPSIRREDRFANKTIKGGKVRAREDTENRRPASSVAIKKPISAMPKKEGGKDPQKRTSDYEKKKKDRRRKKKGRGFFKAKKTRGEDANNKKEERARLEKEPQGMGKRTEKNSEESKRVLAYYSEEGKKKRVVLSYGRKRKK